VVEYDYEDGPITPTLVSHYVYGNGRMVLLERTPDGGPTKSTWYHYNGLGSVVALTDEAGVEVCRWQYDEYGNLLRDCPDSNHYTYTGQEYDPETGLMHFHARYYDADVGVWITQDNYRGSTIDPTSSHRYMYVASNPINVVDIWGYAWWNDAWDAVKDTASDAWDSAKDAASDTWNAVKDTASDAWDAAKDTTSNTWNTVVEKAPEWADTTIRGVSKAITVFKPVLEAVKPGIKVTTNAIIDTTRSMEGGARYIQVHSHGYRGVDDFFHLNATIGPLENLNHLELPGILKHADNIAKGLVVVGIALDIYDLGSSAYKDYQESGGKLNFGDNTKQAVGRVGGGWGGAAAGAAIGSLICPGIGTAIGGVIGGIGGSLGGEWAAKKWW